MNSSRDSGVPNHELRSSRTPARTPEFVHEPIHVLRYLCQRCVFSEYNSKKLELLGLLRHIVSNMSLIFM